MGPAFRPLISQCRSTWKLGYVVAKRDCLLLIFKNRFWWSKRNSYSCLSFRQYGPLLNGKLSGLHQIVMCVCHRILLLILALSLGCLSIHLTMYCVTLSRMFLHRKAGKSLTPAWRCPSTLSSFRSFTPFGPGMWRSLTTCDHRLENPMEIASRF